MSNNICTNCGKTITEGVTTLKGLVDGRIFCDDGCRIQYIKEHKEVD